MSLNGLDEAPVIEAYQAALTEAGGWFLLKYIARDAVDLLGRGTGGVPEVRNAVGNYEEKSPLYGFVQYRRRKVILKYVPEGTSRLLQARLTVQFQSISEKFTPNDAIFTFTTANELTENALSSVCMLHASANSLTSSSSSLRRKRLDEITEAAEEGNAPATDKRSSSKSTHLEVDETQRHGRGEPSPLAKASPMNEVQAAENHQSSDNFKVPDTPRLVVDSNYIDKPATSTTEDKEPDENNDTDSVAPRPSFAEPRSSFERRKSTQSTRPSIYNIDTVSIYSGYSSHKPKVKLGPRPSADYARRPHTSGTQAGGFEARPVASLPAGVRPSRSRSSASARPSSRRSERSQIASQARFHHQGEEEQQQPEHRSSGPAPLNIQLASLYRPNLIEPTTPASIARSVASTTKTTKATPEKQRLMKALQMRKRQMAEKAKHEEQKTQEEDIPATHNGVLAEGHPSEPSTTRVEEKLDNHAVEIESKPNQMENIEKDSQTESNRVVSPESLPETSEEPSTRGSTFTEEADRLTLDTAHSLGPESLKDSKTDQQQPSSAEDVLQVEVPKEAEIASTDTVRAAESEEKTPVQQTSVEKIAENEKPIDQISKEKTTVEVEQVEEVPAESNIIEQTPVTQKADDPSVVEQSAPNQTPIEHTQDEESTTKPTASGAVKALEDSSEVPHDRTDYDQSTPMAASSVASESVKGQPAISTATNSARPSTDVSSDIGATQKRRRADLEPIKILSGASADASDLSDDESYMDDLDNATVHEAKPVSVSRSPITPIFAKGIHTLPPPEEQPPVPKIPASIEGRPRTISGASSGIHSRWPPKTDDGPNLAVKKVSVSSGISKRIRALEMFSNRESSNSPPPSSSQSVTGAPNLTLNTFKKRASFINKNTSPGSSASITPPATLSYPSPTPTPEPSLVNRLWQPANASAPTLSPQKKRESLSVTARIVRSADKLNGSSMSPSGSSSTLHRSPLIIEREKLEQHLQPTTPIESPKPESPEATKREKRFSFSSTTSFSKGGNSDQVTGRASMSGRRNDPTLPRSASETSSIVDGEERKESRKSRFKKRMAALTSGTRRNKSGPLSPSSGEEDLRSPPTIHEAVEHDKEPPIREIIPQEVDIGDVNVQFPDTLLWKRRFMRIDDQGYLILTPPTMEANTRNISKRYHLSEFRKPTIPDLDRQELPHSILLDFEDGSTLQCACESKYTQQQVLRMLVDAHSAYHQLYSPQ